MSIYAKVKNGDAVIKEMLTQDAKTIYKWLMDHYGEYDTVEIKFKRPVDLRQGREPK